MKKGNQFLFALFMAIAAYHIFLKPDKPSQNPPAGTPVSRVNGSDQVQSLAGDTYGQKGVLNSWPTLSEDFSEVSDSLLTKNYYLVIDGSGSMVQTGCSDGKRKIDAAKDVLKLFLDKIPQDSNLGIFAFDSQGIGERLPLGAFNQPQAAAVIESLYAKGGTPLSISVEEGRKALTAQAQKQLGYGEYNLVVITDGEASNSYEPDSAVRSLLQETPIVLHTVGFCINQQHSLNQPGYTLYKAANNPQALLAGLEDVLAEAPDFDLSEFADN